MMKNRHFIYSIVENLNIIIVTLIAYCIIGILCNLGDSEYIRILKLYELFLLPFAACWVIYSFWDYVDRNTCEVFLSYPRSRLTISFSKITYMVVLYVIIYSILFCFGLKKFHNMKL